MDADVEVVTSTDADVAVPAVVLAVVCTRQRNSATDKPKPSIKSRLAISSLDEFFVSYTMVW